MPSSNIANIQRALQSVSDSVLQQAISQQNANLPQFLVLMEINRRQQLRDVVNLGHSRSTNIRQEMAAGMYEPVKTPSLGIESLQVGSPPIRTRTPQPTQPKGIHSLTGSKL